MLSMKKLLNIAVLLALFNCLPITVSAQDPRFGFQAPDVDRGIVEAVKNGIESTLGQQWRFVSSTVEDDGITFLSFEKALGSKKRVLSLELLFMQSPADAQMRFNTFQDNLSVSNYSVLEGIGEQARIWTASLPTTAIISRQNSVFIYAFLDGGDESTQREIIEFTSVVTQAIANVK